MAIKFSTSGVSDNTSQLYTIKEFKGCDYTTTPTLVDDNRAIEISNYLPQNNALVKRNGWEVVNKIRLDGVYWKVHNIWRLVNHSLTEDNVCYIAFISGVNLYGEYRTHLIYTKDLNYSDDYRSGFSYLYTYTKPIQDTYSYGITFDGRLFIFAQNEYMMVYYEQNKTTSELKCVTTSSVAYTPTTFIGVGRIGGIETPITLEEFNLLNPLCFVELVQYDPKDIETEISFTEANGDLFSYKGVEYDLGSLFGDSKDINIATINDKVIQPDTPIVVEGVGKVLYDYDSSILKIVDMAEIPEEEKGNIKYIKVRVFEQNHELIVEKMRFGIPFGSHGYRDRLFLSGNPNYPNMDIHSCETNDEAENWMDYTYFGDMSYQVFGSDNQKIVGYGLMNTGHMAIIKESAMNEPNLYLRHSEIVSKEISYSSNGDTETVYVEHFPITVSGIKINASSEIQMFNFGNDLLINMASGVYRISATTSTAVQGYEAKEVSYFIRNDLGRDMTGSSSIVHNDKLYICRKNIEGHKRIYVADLNKYSFKDGVQIYDWWVLDNINADKLFVFDDVLYFSDFDKGICKMGEEYFDSFTIESEIITVNDVNYSSEVFMYEEDGTIIVLENSKIINEIYQTTDLEKSYNNFKNKTKISFNNDIYSGLNNVSTEYDSEGKPQVVVFEEKDYDILQYAFINDCPVFHKTETANGFFNYICGINSIQKITTDGVTNTYLEVTVMEENDWEIDYKRDWMLVIPFKEKFDILEMWDRNLEYKLSNAFIENDIWYYQTEDEYGNKSIITIGDIDSIRFNRFEIGINNQKLDFNFNDTNFTGFNEVVFYYNKPVESYWYSKYNDLGRLDYLKTATTITFVPDINFGGYTQIGYKTVKNETGYYALAEKPYIDFENIDFDHFSFGAVKMAKTHSSKKKIKNFSFIQLRMNSNDDSCSSIVSLSFRYKYTRNNKGVK